MNEIDKVFMNRKQRTNLKLMDLFMVAIVLLGHNKYNFNAYSR